MTQTIGTREFVAVSPDLDEQQSQKFMDQRLARLAEIEAQRAELDREYQALRDEMKEQLIVGKFLNVNSDLGFVELRDSVHFDKKGAMREMSPRSLERVRRDDINPAKVRAMFPGIYRRNTSHSPSLRVSFYN